MYVYVWFETAGWSNEPPTEQDQNCIDNGELFVMELKGTDLPPVDQNDLQPVDKCLIGETPDGEKYHYVP